MTPRICGLLLIGTTVVSHHLGAVSIRHDVAEVNYFNLAAGFTAVGRIESSVGLCTASLVSPTKILTAAHCVDNNNDGVLDDAVLSNYAMKFGTDVATPDFTVSNIASITIHPQWSTSNGLAQFDLAVMTLSSPFNSINPMTVHNVDPTGAMGTMVGFGLSGNGQTFAGTSDTLKRAANNQVDHVGNTAQEGFSIQADFDSPAMNTSTFGLNAPLALEGGTATGDSGGPLIVNHGGEDVIVGILNAGFNPFGNASEYGDVSIWAAVNEASNLAFLAANGITVVPEPGAYALLFSVGAMAWVIRKRRRAESVV